MRDALRAWLVSFTEPLRPAATFIYTLIWARALTMAATAFFSMALFLDLVTNLDGTSQRDSVAAKVLLPFAYIFTILQTIASVAFTGSFLQKLQKRPEVSTPAEPTPPPKAYVPLALAIVGAIRAAVQEPEKPTGEEMQVRMPGRRPA